jgi:RNA polymerase sigma-70 factor (ECF subfamily)
MSLQEPTRNVQDELLLLNRAQALDTDALAEIHDTYYVPIFRYISFRVSDYHTAEDLASEVFARLLGALRDHTAPRNTLRGWLFGVASRVVKDYYRKRYRTEETSLDDSMPSLADGPDQIVDAILSQERLHEAMSVLTEDQKNVIALRFGQGMSIREVALTLGKTEGSVKMLQSRAIGALSRQLSSRGVN